jgi:peptide deformylase
MEKNGVIYYIRKNNMKLFEIKRFGDPVLRGKAQKVTGFDKKLSEQLDGMWKALDRAGNGAALAANQVGLLKRIIVINYCGERFELVNPVIVKKEGNQSGYEGCLSLPGLSGRVDRAEQVWIRYQDRNGKTEETERAGDLAVCFQHEIDHLDGILFTDRMSEPYVVNDLTKEKIPVQTIRMLTGNCPVD